jgi:uracil-DNA glycosylase family protein
MFSLPPIDLKSQDCRLSLCNSYIVREIIAVRRRERPCLCKAAEGCHGCDLYKKATQTVFGEGSLQAKLVLVGEQPGDAEDLKGHPFVGPAGKILEKGLEETGIPLETVYITNAVKHFKFQMVGKRRLHKKPSAREVAACKPWLDAEINLIKPKAVVCLGATAARALLGSRFALLKNLGQWQASAANLKIIATYHPSAAL